MPLALFLKSCGPDSCPEAGNLADDTPLLNDHSASPTVTEGGLHASSRYLRRLRSRCPVRDRATPVVAQAQSTTTTTTTTTMPDEQHLGKDQRQLDPDQEVR